MYCIAQVHSDPEEEDTDNYTMLISSDFGLRYRDHGETKEQIGAWPFSAFKNLAMKDRKSDHPSYGFYLILE